MWIYVHLGAGSCRWEKKDTNPLKPELQFTAL